MRSSRNAACRPSDDGTVAPETEALVDPNRALVIVSDRQDDVLDTLPYEIAYYGWQCVSYWVNV